MNLKEIAHKNNSVFLILHKMYSPIRYVKTYKKRTQIVKESIEKLSGLETKLEIIFYFGVPMHTNLGDLAQTYCAINWCKENYPEREIVCFQSYSCYSKKFISMLKKKIKRNDIIMVQSGYCTKETHRDHPMHLTLVRNFPDNRIVFMPQTVNFKDQKEYKRTANIYNRHEHLLFLARDRVSFDSAKSMFNDTMVKLYPDVVTTLIGAYNSTCERNGILFCIRNDSEQRYPKSDFDKIAAAFPKLRCDYTDTTVDVSNRELLKNLEMHIGNKLKQFSQYQVVITDRYHGTIFSLVTNTPVIVLATVDHKVVTGLDWFKGIYEEQSVQLADSINDAMRMAKKIIDSGYTCKNQAYFKDNYYSKLKNEIERI